jgi:hypothetical protein
MPLIRDRLEHLATKYFTQAGHRQTAIEQAVHYVREGFARSNAHDLLVSALSPPISEWVIETIYQGAYVREYHIWEKSCKEYFSSKEVDTKPKKGEAFTALVKRVLSQDLVVDVPEDVMDALSTMRCKVNRMKHDAGVRDHESISAENYAAAVEAIERFWEFMGEHDTLTT